MKTLLRKQKVRKQKRNLPMNPKNRKKLLLMKKRPKKQQKLMIKQLPKKLPKRSVSSKKDAAVR